MGEEMTKSRNHKTSRKCSEAKVVLDLQAPSWQVGYVAGPKVSTIHQSLVDVMDLSEQGCLLCRLDSKSLTPTSVPASNLIDSEDVAATKPSTASVHDALFDSEYFFSLPLATLFYIHVVIVISFSPPLRPTSSWTALHSRSPVYTRLSWPFMQVIRHRRTETQNRKHQRRN